MLFIELSEEEKKKPYSKYMYKELAEPTDEVKEFLKNIKEMDIKDALIPENGNIDDILNEGYLKDEYGVCTLPNGGGYVAMLNKMPGVTIDMYNFWNKWWSSSEDGTLRYRIWNPKCHFKAGYRWTCEDVGLGVEDLIFLEKVTPEKLGLDIEKVKKSSLLLADGGNVMSKVVNAEPMSAPKPGVVCHFVREMEDGSGIELRTRFWKGYQIGPNGLFSAMGPDTPKETLESLKLLAEHNAYEMANLASFLPSLYEEERHTVGM